MLEAPLRAVVVDDEPAAREAVRTLLANEPAVVIVDEAANGRSAVEVIRRAQPDLVFLDVQMPDLDGFEVLEALGADVPRGIIFVTAHDEHAIRAFEVHALDYLLKPFGRPRFDAAVGRAIERLSALDALTLQRTLQAMAAERGAAGDPASELSFDRGTGNIRREPVRRIGVRDGARTRLVDVSRIDWIEANGDYSRLHTGNESHLVTTAMSALEQMLDAGTFLRIHRSIIVNLLRIRELHRDSDGGGVAILESGLRLRVARGRWDTLATTLGIAS